VERVLSEDRSGCASHPGGRVSTVVVIPWWPDTADEWRYRWRDQIVRIWQEWGYAVVLGVGREGQARNRGIEQAIEEYGAEIIVTCDADSILTRSQAEKGIEWAREKPGLVIPHDRYVYLSKLTSTDRTAGSILASLESFDGRWPVGRRGQEVEFVGGVGVGGPSMFSVETWRQAGGYDEKIVRAYDGAFALACGTLVGPQSRLSGDYVHLWHPRDDLVDPPETWEAMQEYHRAAESGIKAMTDLVASRR
jgi:hypothetical protein